MSSVLRVNDRLYSAGDRDAAALPVRRRKKRKKRKQAMRQEGMKGEEEAGGGIAEAISDSFLLE